MIVACRRIRCRCGNAERRPRKRRITRCFRGCCRNGFRHSSGLPAMFAEQRNESHGSDVLLLELAVLAGEEMQNLLLTVPERYEKLALLCQLLDVRRRDFGRSCADEYRIERSEFAPAEGSVTQHEGDVVRAHLF